MTISKEPEVLKNGGQVSRWNVNRDTEAVTMASSITASLTNDMCYRFYS